MPASHLLDHTIESERREGTARSRVAASIQGMCAPATPFITTQERYILILVHRQIKDERSHEQRATFMRTNLLLHSEISSYKTSCKGCHDADSPSISMSFLSINQISLASISQSKKLLHCGARYPMCHFPRIGSLLSQLKTLIHCEASYFLCYFPIIGGLPDNHDCVSI